MEDDPNFCLKNKNDELKKKEDNKTKQKCRRGEIKDQEIKRSRDQELYQGVGNRKIYSYFGEALKGGRWYSSVKYMRETLEQIYIHLNKSNLISCYASI